MINGRGKLKCSDKNLGLFHHKSYMGLNPDRQGENKASNHQNYDVYYT